MRAVLTAGGVSLLLALLGTPLFIRFLVYRKYGQFVRDDGPTSHHTKRGTPTMGGAVIIGATVIAYFVAHLVTLSHLTVSGLLVLGLMVGLGTVGFLDDFIKISKERSLGLRSVPKLVGQSVVAVLFAVLALQFPSDTLRRPISTAVSFTRDTTFDFAAAGPIFSVILVVIWVQLIIAATSNGVNLTDGLDGLATGATAMVAGAYVLIGIWQNNQWCAIVENVTPQCYETRDPLDLAVVAAALMGACIGFLWWNGSPAKIFMGDTGSLALGGALAGLAMTTRTELLLVLLGGLFVITTLSVLLQVASFKLTGKRLFRMAPLHHHFELAGWGEVTIVIRFWIISGIFAAMGLGLFYAEWVVS